MNHVEPLRNDPEGRIVANAPYGQHIALTCINHTSKRWSTKNIGSIGCRTIFYDLMGDSVGSECDCHMHYLRPLAKQ
jgi:hypothetical protein